MPSISTFTFGLNKPATYDQLIAGEPEGKYLLLLLQIRLSSGLSTRKIEIRAMSLDCPPSETTISIIFLLELGHNVLLHCQAKFHPAHYLFDPRGLKVIYSVG